ncbi:hypothetical protein Goarm_011534 [Gossypium armourianum]|uniref:Uncharacterized protein n=1 Tax=Gossypium armourianum TaxID=34283 RepID=A0A7J9IX56_9ROSI|nr:hypothetical protein [Gossypium armourianum]
MRCKEHLTDLSSSVGVCATCLRERLLAVVAAQAQAQAQLARAAESRRKPDPPPLVFPRTPQVGPTYGATTNGDFEAARSFKKKNRVSLFSNLFRSRSEKFNSDPNVRYRRDLSDEPSSSSSSPSWFSAFFAVRRKKQQFSRTTHVEEFGQFGTGDRKSYRITDRGMSPVIIADTGDGCDRLPSGLSPEASPRWKRTPTAARSGVKNVSGLAFCMSPLVRASPNRHWNQKGGLPPDITFTGDGRPTMKPQLATAAGFSANRSRKLADMGTVNYNR